MKLVLALLLVAFFAVGAVVHAHWIDRGHRKRDAVWGEPISPQPEVPESPPAVCDNGWSLLVVGRPSGRPPVNVDAGPRSWREQHDLRETRGSVAVAAPAEPEQGAVDLAPAAEIPTTTRRASEVLADFELVVSPGQTLSQICEDAYGTARGGLLQSLARYNGLDSPDKIRVGQKVLIPEKAKLVATR